MYRKRLTLLLALLPLAVFASMDPSQWRREILIGSDHDNFYTYEINRSQPGSYYEKTKSTNFIVYSKKTGSIKQKLPMMRATYTRDQDKNIWTTNDRKTTKVDISIYYQGKTFEWFFPEDSSIISKLNISKKGLTINTRHGTKLITYKVLPKLIFDLDYEEENPRIVSVYIDRTNLYILAQRGMSSDDANHIQEILLIDMKQYAEARGYSVEQ